MLTCWLYAFILGLLQMRQQISADSLCICNGSKENIPIKKLSRSASRIHYNQYTIHPRENKNTACKHLEIQTGENRKLRGIKNILPLCCKFHYNQVKLVNAFTLRMTFLFHTVDFWFQHHGIHQMETLILSLDREAMNCASIKNELSILTSIILPLY